MNFVNASLMLACRLRMNCVLVIFRIYDVSGFRCFICGWYSLINGFDSDLGCYSSTYINEDDNGRSL